MKPDGSLSEADVARVFSALADEYASKVEATEGKRTLQRIQDRSRAGVPRLPARRLAMLTLAPAAAAAGLTIAVTSSPGLMSKVENKQIPEASTNDVVFCRMVSQYGLSFIVNGSSLMGLPKCSSEMV